MPTPEELLNQYVAGTSAWTSATVILGEPPMVKPKQMAVKRCYCILPVDGNLGVGSTAYQITSPKAQIGIFYYNKLDALEAAKEFAEAHPKVPVLVLGAIALVESKKPETTAKEFKDNGELIPSREEG